MHLQQVHKGAVGRAPDPRVAVLGGVQQGGRRHARGALGGGGGRVARAQRLRAGLGDGFEAVGGGHAELGGVVAAHLYQKRRWTWMVDGRIEGGVSSWFLARGVSNQFYGDKLWSTWGFSDIYLRHRIKFPMVKPF